MGAGAGHVTTGAARVMLMNTMRLAGRKFVGLSGVNCTRSGWALVTRNTVPAGGTNWNEPEAFTVAFSCAAESAVPWTMDAGFDQVMVGVAGATVMLTLCVATVKLARSLGVKTTASCCAAPASRIVPAAGE